MTRPTPSDDALPMLDSPMTAGDAPTRAAARTGGRRSRWRRSPCVFFVGIIAAQFIGGPATGIGVVGAAVLLFLVVAIGRNLRRAHER